MQIALGNPAINSILILKEYFRIVKKKNKQNEKKVLDIINEIRAAKDLTAVEKLNSEDNLRDNLGLNSFDLAELTVKIEDEFDIDIFEDGLVNTIGEIYEKLA